MDPTRICWKARGTFPESKDEPFVYTFKFQVVTPAYSSVAEEVGSRAAKASRLLPRRRALHETCTLFSRTMGFQSCSAARKHRRDRRLSAVGKRMAYAPATAKVATSNWRVWVPFLRRFLSVKGRNSRLRATLEIPCVPQWRTRPSIPGA